MQYGAKVGGSVVNRQEVFTTTVKGPMLGMYTDTNKNQANDFTQDLLQNAHGQCLV
jgi:hypothetical protein